METHTPDCSVHAFDTTHCDTKLGRSCAGLSEQHCWDFSAKLREEGIAQNALHKPRHSVPPFQWLGVVLCRIGGEAVEFHLACVTRRLSKRIQTFNDDLTVELRVAARRQSCSVKEHCSGTLRAGSAQRCQPPVRDLQTHTYGFQKVSKCRRSCEHQLATHIRACSSTIEISSKSAAQRTTPFTLTVAIGPIGPIGLHRWNWVGHLPQLSDYRDLLHHLLVLHG